MTIHRFNFLTCVLDVKTPENARKALSVYYISGTEPEREFPVTILSNHRNSCLSITNTNPETVIGFVRLCAKAFSLSGLWGFEWQSAILTEDGVKSHGGGAIVLDLSTGEIVDRITTEDWLSERLPRPINPRLN